MSKLSDVNIDALSVFPAKDDPSLAELLLGAEAADDWESTRKVSVTKNKNAAAAGTRSRKQRRGRSSQARSRKRASRSSDNSFIRARRMQEKQDSKAKKKKQAKNQARVEEYQTQSGTRQGDKAEQITQGPQRSGAGVDKSRSIELKPYSRPVVLGLFDYLPWYEDGDEENRTAAGNVAFINFAKKHINLRDIIIKGDYSSYTPNLLDYSRLAQYQGTLNKFLWQLDIIGSSDTTAVTTQINDILAYLALDPISANEASNTEILMTLIRDFASVLQGCSPQLVEADTRGFSAGTELPPSPQELSLLGKTALAQTSNFIEYYESSMSTFDVEQICKIFLNTIAQEVKTSINKKRADENSTIDEILQTSPARLSMMPDSDGNGPFGIVSSAEGAHQFLFEPGEIATFNNTKFNSAADYVEQRVAYRADLSSTTSSAAAATAITDAELYNVAFGEASAAHARINALLDYSWCSNPNVAAIAQSSEYFSQFIFRSCLQPLKDILAEESGNLTQSNALQLYFLCLAANDTDIMRSLMLYLAALRDYVPPAPPAAPSPTGTFSSRGSLRGSSLQSIVDTYSPRSSESFSTAPFANSYATSALGSSAFAGATISEPAAPSVETSTTTYMQQMNAVSSNVSGRFSGSRSRSYASSMVFGHSSPSSGPNVGQSNSVSSFISQHIGEEEMSAEEFVSAAFQTQAASIAKFLFQKIEERTSGSETKRETEGDFSSIFSLDEDEVTDILAQEPVENNVMTQLLAAWEAVSAFSVDGISMESEGSPDITSYSGFQIQNLESAFFVCCSKLYDSILSRSWTVTDEDKDTPDLSLVLDTEVTSLVNSNIAALWSPDEYWTILDANPYLQQVATIQAAIQDEERLAYSAFSIFPAYFGAVYLRWAHLMTECQAAITIDGKESSVAKYVAQGTGKSLSSDSLSYLMSCNTADGGMEAGLHSESPAGTSMEVMVDGEASADSKKIQSFLTTRILNIDRDEDPTRLLAVALPNGLLDALQSDPVSITDLNRSSHITNTDVYELILEKIDVTRSDLVYEPKTYYFPRKTLTRYWNSSLGWQTGAQNAFGVSAQFVEWDGGSSASSMTWTDYLTEADNSNTGYSGGYGTKAPEQKAKSEALKLYVEHMYGVSLRLHDFPADDERQKEAMAPKVPISAWSSIDTTSSTFLSASNLAFMSEKTTSRFPNNMEWWDPAENAIDFGANGQNFPKNAEEHALLSFINTYGSIPPADYYEKVSSGLIFEDIVCIEFDHRDWVIQEQSDQSAALTEAEEEEVYGIQTSSGLDFGQYRVTIRLPEIGEI